MAFVPLSPPRPTTVTATTLRTCTFTSRANSVAVLNTTRRRTRRIRQRFAPVPHPSEESAPQVSVTRAIFVWSGPGDPLFGGNGESGGDGSGDDEADDEAADESTPDDHSNGDESVGEYPFSVEDRIFGGRHGRFAEDGHGSVHDGHYSGASAEPMASMFGSEPTLEDTNGACRLFDSLRQYTKGPDDLARLRSDASEYASDAFKRTVLGIVGALPSEAYEVTITSDRSGLRRLLVSSLSTGYALRNAEFRMILNESLSPTFGSTSSSSAHQSHTQTPSLPEDAVQDTPPKRGRPVSGKKSPTSSMDDSSQSEPEYMKNVPFRERVDASSLDGNVQWWDTTLGARQEMNAKDYVARLEAENELLRDRLRASVGYEDQGGNKLLDFMKTMSKDKIEALQSDMSAMTEDTFRRVVKSILGDVDSIKVQTTYSTNRDYLAQLTFWCLLVGYTVRNLEKRVEMQALFEGSESSQTPLASPPPPSHQNPPDNSASL